MAAPCPSCGADLFSAGEMTCVGWVDPEYDPEGKTRADLVLECQACGKAFNAFVPLDDFQQIEAT